MSVSTLGSTMNVARERVGIGSRELGVDPDLPHDLLAVRLREVHVDRHHLLEHVEIRGEDRGRTVQEHHVAHEEHELLRCTRPIAEELLRDLAHLAHQLVGRHLRGVLHRTVEVEVGDDEVEVDIGRERAEVAQRGQLPTHVARSAEHEETQECQPLRFVETAGDAEVEERVRPSGCTTRLPPCRSPWNTPKISAPSSDAMRPACSIAWVSMPAACIDSTSSKANPRSRSMTSTRRVTMVGCGRGTMIPLWPVREDVGDVEHVLRFEAEVELLDDGLREQLHEGRRIGEGGDRDAADEMGGEPGQRGDVVPEELRDLRPLHLDDDLFTGDEPGRVHLCDRGGRDRLLVEGREQILEPPAEVDLHDGADVVERLRRHPVAQLLELGDHLVGEQAFAARDDLAELHVARAEATEGLPQATGDPGTRLRPPVLEDEPSGQGTGDLGDSAREAPERRQPTGCEQARHLLARAPPQTVDLPAPRDLVGIEHPGPAIAERAELEIRRGSGTAIGSVMTPPKLPVGSRNAERPAPCTRATRRSLAGYRSAVRSGERSLRSPPRRSDAARRRRRGAVVAKRLGVNSRRPTAPHPGWRTAGSPWRPDPRAMPPRDRHRRGRSDLPHRRPSSRYPA